MRGERVGPYTLEIHPTYRCNLRCTFCKYHTARTRNEVDLNQEMPLNRWMSLLDEASSMGVCEVRVCGGGEPLYNRTEAIELACRIKEGGMRGSLLTNATLFSRDFARRMVDIGWDEIEVSIDGPDATVHDRLRGIPGALGRSTDTLRWILERKRETAVTLPYVKIYYVVVAQNYHLLPQMVKYCQEHGVDELFLLSLCPGGLREDSHRLNAEQAAECLRLVAEAQKVAEGSSLRFCADFIENAYGSGDACGKDSPKEKNAPGGGPHDVLNSPCYDPWTYLQIHFDGKVGPCCNTYVGEIPEVRSRSLREVWLGSEHLNRIRRSLLNWKFSGGCRDCGTHHLRDAARIRPLLVKLIGDA